MGIAPQPHVFKREVSVDFHSDFAALLSLVLMGLSKVKIAAGSLEISPAAIFSETVLGYFPRFK